MPDKKLKRMLPLILQHIQKTNEIIAAVITALQEAEEAGPVNTAPVTAPQNPPKDIMGIKAAAEYCGYSKSYIYQLVHRKEIPYHKPTGDNGRVFFKRGELDAFTSRGKRDSGYELGEKAAAILNGEAE